MPAKIVFSNDQIKFILKDYSNKKSVSDIAASYNVSRQTILRLLKNNNIDTSNRTHIFNENIFECIDRSEKAYWLGFILADGYVHEKRGVLRIKLQEQDESHLRKFIDFLSGDYGMIKYEYHNITGNKQYYAEVNSRKLVDDLVKLNIRQGKSSGKEQLSEIPYWLIRDYIRGIWDGDGHIKAIRIDLISSVEVLDFVQKYLYDNCYTNINKILNHCNTHRIYVCKNRHIALQHLYYNGCVSLKRKYDLVKQLVDNKHCRPESTVA